MWMTGLPVPLGRPATDEELLGHDTPPTGLPYVAGTPWYAEDGRQSHGLAGEGSTMNPRPGQACLVSHVLRPSGSFAGSLRKRNGPDPVPGRGRLTSLQRECARHARGERMPAAEDLDARGSTFHRDRTATGVTRVVRALGEALDA